MKSRTNRLFFISGRNLIYKKVSYYRQAKPAFFRQTTHKTSRLSLQTTSTATMQQILHRANKATKQLNININRQSQIDHLELAEILISILDYPDLEKAQRYSRANKLGNYDLIEEQKLLSEKINQNEECIQENICQCCGLMVHSHDIPFCTPLEQINIGLGTHLFFLTILFNVLIFFMVFLVFSLYSLITNVNECEEESVIDCGIAGLGLSYKFVNISGTSDDTTESLRIASILGIVVVCLWGLIEVYKNHRQRAIAVKIDNQFVQASDFTLMVENFPTVYLRPTYAETLQEVRRIFKKYQEFMLTVQPFEVEKICVARNLYTQTEENCKRQQRLDEKLQQLQTKFKQWIMERKTKRQFSTPYEQRQIQYEKYYQFFTNEYDTSPIYKGKEGESVIIFVTMKHSKARQQIEENTRPCTPVNCFNLCHENHFPIQNVKISKAPPPEEIKWLNIGFPTKRRVCRLIAIYGVAFIFLAISLGIVVGLNQLQIDQSQLYISILISIGITLINFLLEFSLMMMSKYLNEITETRMQFNIAFKICLFELLNVIGVPLLALYISQRELFGENGLSNDIFFIALFNILPPIGRFIDPFYLFVEIRNRINESPNNRLLNFNGQKQFNKIYDSNEFDLGYEYAYIIKTSIFTSFFLSLQPIISVFACIGLGLFWLVNRYRVFYRFTKPRYYSSTVNSLVGYLLNLSPIVFGLGLLVFTNWQKQYNVDDTQFLNWIIVGIGGFFLFFPFRFMYKYCVSEPKYESWVYDDQRAIIPSEYDRMNPVTKDKAIEQHRQYLKELEIKKKLPQTAKYLNQSVIRGADQGDQMRRTIAVSGNGLRKSALRGSEHSIKVSQKDINLIGNNQMRRNADEEASIEFTRNNDKYKESENQLPEFNGNIESYEELIKSLKGADHRRM